MTPTPTLVVGQPERSDTLGRLHMLLTVALHCRHITSMLTL